MGRIINTASPGSERNRLRRTIAEILRHLMFKRGVDDEVKDMTATSCTRCAGSPSRWR